MLRTAVLFLIFAVGFGAITPLTNGYAEASSEMPQKHKKNRKKYKKFSKQWWRAYHRRVKHRRELAAHRRSLRLRQMRLTNAANGAENGAQTLSASNQKSVAAKPSVPVNDKKRNANLAKNFVVENNGGSSVTVVSPAQGADDNNPRSKTVGGIPTSSLRRTIIDQMIKEEGWVVNDYQKEVGGKKVYVVVAQSPGAGGAVQARMFCFTEAEGRIYRVATSAPDKNLARIEQESEKIIAALQRKSSTQQAELK